jgi:zinc transport system substrate-binding protein
MIRAAIGDIIHVDYLVKSNISAHGYSIKPSDIEKLKSAHMIVIIDRRFDIELWNIAQKMNLVSKVIELSNTPDLVLYEYRNIQITSHDEADNHHAHHHHDHNHHHHTANMPNNDVDFHIWLDLSNAKKMIAYLVSKLVETSSYRIHDFERNLLSFSDQCDNLDYEMTHLLTGVQNKGFVVLHDGYQYIEKKYKLHNLGAIYYGAGEAIGVKTLLKFDELIKSANVSCILTEPYLQSSIVTKLKDNRKLKIVEIDGEAIHTLPLNKTTYFTMLHNIAKQIAYCLK